MDAFLIIDQIALGKPAVYISLLPHFYCSDKKVTLSAFLTLQPDAQAAAIFVCSIISVSKLCLEAPHFSASKKVQGKDEGKILECIVSIALV